MKQRMKSDGRYNLLEMRYQRWLENNPTDSHENSKLERSGVGE